VLRLELFDHGVGVTTVFPGGVRTRIAANSRRAARVPIQEFEAGRDWVAARLSYPPERAAAEILAAVQRRRPRVLITQTAQFLDLIARLASAGQAKALERIFGRDRHRHPPRHTAFRIDHAPGHRDPQ
jgi:short-subunit dehydrogenase